LLIDFVQILVKMVVAKFRVAKNCLLSLVSIFFCIEFFSIEICGGGFSTAFHSSLHFIVAHVGFSLS